jgi:ankyrin repeat protein
MAWDTHPILMAAALGDVEWVRNLASTSPGVVDKTGPLSKTALMYAAGNGHDEVVELLLNELGANPHAKSDTNSTALHCASQDGEEQGMVSLCPYEAFTCSNIMPPPL